MREFIFFGVICLGSMVIMALVFLLTRSYWAASLMLGPTTLAIRSARLLVEASFRSIIEARRQRMKESSKRAKRS